MNNFHKEAVGELEQMACFTSDDFSRNRLRKIIALIKAGSMCDEGDKEIAE